MGEGTGDILKIGDLVSAYFHLSPGDIAFSSRNFTQFFSRAFNSPNLRASDGSDVSVMPEIVKRTEVKV